MSAVEQGGDIGDVVSEQGWPAVEVEGEVVGDVGGPRESSMSLLPRTAWTGAICGQLSEDVGAADVAGVEDQVAALDRG